MLLQVAGTGDELQGIKRGIMEISDAILINKCDGDNVKRCELAAQGFRNALHFFPMPESGWQRKVLTYSGFYGYGIKEVWEMVFEYFDFVKKNGYFEKRRQEQNKDPGHFDADDRKNGIKNVKQYFHNIPRGRNPSLRSSRKFLVCFLCGSILSQAWPYVLQCCCL
jgi:putative protein kinase ArgK-like GTPase of G3E family